jgi:hypothetical protein
VGQQGIDERRNEDTPSGNESHGVILQEMKSRREETMACPEKRKAVPEEIEVITERQKVPNKEAAEEVIEVLMDRSEEQRPAVEC